MDIAIHKTTGKIVSAFQLMKNLEWIGKEREEFIAPYHEIGNWVELQNKGINCVDVSFVKYHIRNRLGNKEIVSPHFRIKTEEAIENPLNESEEHKVAKENIYLNIMDDKLILSIKEVGEKKISELGEIEDVRIEKGIGYKRADVKLTFKNFKQKYYEELLNRGIVFEIQLSPQDKDTTEERSYDRATYGYSIVWVTYENLKDISKLTVIPYQEAIKEYHHQLDLKVNKKIWDMDERMENKRIEIESEIKNLIEIYHTKKEVLHNEINKIFDYGDKIKDKEREGIGELEANLEKELAEAKIHLYEKINNELKIDNSVELNVKKFLSEFPLENVAKKKLDEYIPQMLSQKLNVILEKELAEAKKTITVKDREIKPMDWLNEQVERRKFEL